MFEKALNSRDQNTVSVEVYHPLLIPIIQKLAKLYIQSVLVHKSNRRLLLLSFLRRKHLGK